MSDSSSGVPNILSIAGTDPTGGAGIHADLKSIAANGGYGMAVVTALVAQNTCGVREVHVPPIEFLAAQLDAVSDDVRIDAVKIGMLGTPAVIEVVADWIVRTRPPIVVLDPVMVAASGDRLLDPAAERALQRILPLADLITPNVPELAAIADAASAERWDDLVEQGRAVAARLGVRVLAKGGHLDGAASPDALIEASGEVTAFGGERIATANTHGTGCSLSAGIATRITRTPDWVSAVAAARGWLRESLIASDTLAVGRGSGPLHHFAGLWARGGVDATVPAAVDAAADAAPATAGVSAERVAAEPALPR